ncbi:hypothetical protein [Bartonella sp. MM73XJBT.G]|nr:hypothetical protein [Bartonella sp. MM73XJBT.G]
MGEEGVNGGVGANGEAGKVQKKGGIGMGKLGKVLFGEWGKG